MKQTIVGLIKKIVNFQGLIDNFKEPFISNNVYIYLFIYLMSNI